MPYLTLTPVVGEPRHLHARYQEPQRPGLRSGAITN